MAVTRVGGKVLQRADLQRDRQSIDNFIKYVRALMKEVCGSGIRLRAKGRIRITDVCPSPDGDSTDLCVALRSLLAFLEEQRARLGRPS